MLKTKYFFRILAIYTMIMLYLPIVAIRVPEPMNSPASILLLWLIALIFTNIKVLVSRSMLFIYLFIVIYFLLTQLIWNDKVIETYDNNFLRWIMIRQIGFATLGIIMARYFYISHDLAGMRIVAFSAVFFIVTTSIGFILSPEYAKNYMKIRGSINSSGINAYSFFSSLVFLSPLVVYFIKDRVISYKKKTLIFILFLLILYAIALDSRTTAFVFSVIFFGLPLVINTSKSYKPLIIMGIAILLLFTVFKFQVADLLNNIAGNFSGTTFESRLNDLAMAIEISDYDSSSDKTYTSSVRLNILNISIESFINSPIFGGKLSGGHSFWFDILALHGIIGIIPWLLILYSEVRLNIANFSSEYKLFYILSLISFILFGIFKSGLQDPQTMVSFFFLVPSFYYLKFSNNNP